MMIFQTEKFNRANQAGYDNIEKTGKLLGRVPRRAGPSSRCSSGDAMGAGTANPPLLFKEHAMGLFSIIALVVETVLIVFATAGNPWRAAT